MSKTATTPSSYYANAALSLAAMGLGYHAAWYDRIPWTWWGGLVLVLLGILPVSIAADLIKILRLHNRALDQALAIEPPPRAAPSVPPSAPTQPPGSPPPAPPAPGGTATLTSILPPVERLSLAQPGLGGLADAIKGGSRRLVFALAAAGLLLSLSGCASGPAAGTSSGASTSAMIRAAVRFVCGVAPTAVDLVDAARGSVAPPPSSGGQAALLLGSDAASAVVLIRPGDVQPQLAPAGTSPTTRPIGPRPTGDIEPPR